MHLLLDSFFQYEFQGSRKSKCQLGSDSYHYYDKVNWGSSQEEELK